MKVSWYFQQLFRRIHGYCGRIPCLVWRCPRLSRWSLHLWVYRRFHRLDIRRTTCEDDEIIVLAYAHCFYLGRADNCSGVASEFGKFGLDIAEGSSNRESSRECSVRSKDKAVFFPFVEDLQIRIGISNFGSKYCWILTDRSFLRCRWSSSVRTHHSPCDRWKDP
jgi:hypothetical protein